MSGSARWGELRDRLSPDGRRGPLVCAAVGMFGVIAALLGWIFAPADFAFAWLAAVTFWLGWPLGGMALLLVHALTGGRWMRPIRPFLLAGVATLPLLLPFLLPWLLNLATLYPWARPGGAALEVNGAYLNVPFFLARWAVYAVLWLGMAALVMRAERRPDPPAALRGMAGPGLILLMLTGSFSAIDATMSLDPHFNSSIYGMMFAAQSGLLALAAGVAGAALVASSPDDVPMGNDLGRMMVGLLILWAYLDFVQLLIVWMSDLRTDGPWYAKRLAGGWGVLAAIVFVLHFLLPFFALLWPRLRRSREGLLAVAVLVVAMQAPRAWWLVLPESPAGFGLLAVPAMLGVAGLAGFVALRARSVRGALARREVRVHA